MIATSMTMVRLPVSAAGVPDSILSEDLLRRYVDLLVRLVEAVGAIVIFVGAVLAAVHFARAAFRGQKGAEFVRVRLGLGRYLTLGLEFQLASDVLSTAIAPTFNEIGKLAAIAAIRTALNYFLGKEIDSERREVEQERAGDRARSDVVDTGP
ncbi:MAG: DUF1622 domain-containing protein [Ornithinibacter sp.]